MKGDKLGKVFIPYAEMTDEQKHEFHVLGGKAAQQKNKERRALKNYLLHLLESETKTGNIAEDMCWALIKKALAGDVKAFQAIEESIGQKQAAKVEATVDNNIIKVTVEDEDE